MPQMRKIPLKTLGMGETEFKYSQVLQDVLRTPKNPQAGATQDEILKKVPIQLELVKGGQHLMATDEQWKELIECLKAFHWRVVVPEIASLIEDVAAAPLVRVEEPPQAAEQSKPGE